MDVTFVKQWIMLKEYLFFESSAKIFCAKYLFLWDIIVTLHFETVDESKNIC